jgi:hypothetical protein
LSWRIKQKVSAREDGSGNLWGEEWEGENDISSRNFDLGWPEKGTNVAAKFSGAGGHLGGVCLQKALPSRARSAAE